MNSVFPALTDLNTEPPEFGSVSRKETEFLSTHLKNRNFGFDFGLVFG